MTHPDVWTIIIGLGIGTYLIRLSFIGLVGDRDMPPWLLRMLRYTPVAILPGLVTPMLIGQGATELEPSRLAAAVVTVAVGLVTRNVFYAIIAGMGLFVILGALGV
ncbi:AzlD domain-containing protein [Celeribacter arenosi]|uniref:AzlD domain-containing protein n=1 Tax=Celeribacter arenosi TaxID=792649 RepID=A0ABP7K0L9_9RHOB